MNANVRRALFAFGVVCAALVVIGHCDSVATRDALARDSCEEWIRALEEWKDGPGHGKYPRDERVIALQVPACALTDFYQVTDDLDGYGLRVKAAPVFGMTGFQFYFQPPGTWSRMGL
jgi:hypothetical protein